MNVKNLREDHRDKMGRVSIELPRQIDVTTSSAKSSVHYFPILHFIHAHLDDIHNLAILVRGTSRGTMKAQEQNSDISQTKLDKQS